MRLATIGFAAALALTSSLAFAQSGGSGGSGAGAGGASGASGSAGMSSGAGTAGRVQPEQRAAPDPAA
jgi:hypothetical protein